MQYSPKLKKIMEQIKDILKKNDIGGFVVLHEANGFTEYLNHINPSYSCAFLQDGQFRVKLKAADLPGGKEQAKQLAEGTYNMVSSMTDVIALHAKGYMHFEEMLREHWGGENNGSSHTSHDQQNN
jgi:hypothetical protein